MTHDIALIFITIGISVPGSAAITTLIFWASIGLRMTRRIEQLAKRNDRVEKVLPPIAFGVWGLLRIHVNEHNGGSDPDVKKAYDDLQDVVFPAIVSQKAEQP